MVLVISYYADTYGGNATVGLRLPWGRSSRKGAKEAFRMVISRASMTRCSQVLYPISCRLHTPSIVDSLSRRVKAEGDLELCASVVEWSLFQDRGEGFDQYHILVSGKNGNNGSNY